MSSSGSKVSYYPEMTLPPELLAFEQEQPDQLRVGAAGKEGILRVNFKLDADAKTIIDKQYTQIPFHITRVLRLDEHLPGMAFLYIQMPTGGLLQGDRLRAEISLEQGAQAHVTTQSVSKVYRMNKNYASQVLEVRVDEGAFFEYYPDALLLQKDARYAQETRLIVHDNATAIYGEIVLPGRVARGEAFDYDIYHSALVAENQDHQPRFRESVLLEPKRRSLKRKGMLGSWSTFGNFYVLTRAVDVDRLSDEVHRTLQRQESILGGCSLLPFHDGIVARILGEHHRHVKAAMDQVWDCVRQHIMGVPAPQIRK